MADEPKVFPPSPEFSKNAWIKSLDEYEASVQALGRGPGGLLGGARRGRARVDQEVGQGPRLELRPGPYIKWFEGGELNASYNCLDRHVEAGKGDKAAIVFEGDPGDTRTYTYKELLDEVSRFANVLKKHGVKKGDRVALYLPMIAELPIVMLACARIGAIHMMVFGGFSAEALKARIDNCGAKVLICADKGHRGAKATPSKTNADVAISGETTVEKVIVIKRVDGDVPMQDGRDVWYHDEMAAADITADCPPVPVDAEHPLFILYTSGSTGTPKGVLHSTGGYLLYVARHVQVRVRPARRRHPLLHGRHRLDHRSQLHRLRPAEHGRHQRPLRGPADVPRAGPLLAGRREAQDDHHLHGADRHPQPHRPGRRVGRQARHAQRCA